MSGSPQTAASGAAAIAGALARGEPSWVTLHDLAGEPFSELRPAIEAFDAGPRAAAEAATAWLKEGALRGASTARTRLLVAEGRVLGFYALASTEVELRSKHRRGLPGADPKIVRVPGTLVAWLARDRRSDIDGKLLLMHAAATARRARELQATTVLVVDAYDEETERMWRERFGFRSSADARPRRLWIPLD